jgi:hypothetical protein
VTASRPDLPARASLLLAPLAVTLLAACRGGLPPEPPGADAADPDAAVAPYRIEANPYEVSAFAGEQPARSDPHAGHGENHGGAADPHAGHGDMNHGATTDPHAGHGENHGATTDAHAGHGPTGHGSGAPAAAPKRAEQPR